MATTGSKTRRNPLKAVCAVMVTTTEEIQAQLAAKFPKGVPVFNLTTKELLISPADDTYLHELQDHRHPYTHAPLVHSHMYGANQAWFITEPRLWLRSDLDNHPELVPCDGQELTDDQAEYLAEVYDGTRAIMGDSYDITTSAVGSTGSSAALFNTELTISNFHLFSDQWLTGSTSTTDEQYVRVAFSNAITYRPVQYVMSPAVGTASGGNDLHPTPASWVFEGSVNGTSWDQLDSQTLTENDWKAYELREFTVDTDAIYSQFRIRITSWFNGTGETGLKRFYIKGHKNGAFSMPHLPAPSSEFAWVVPIRNQDIGLKREDVGDVNFTSVLPANLPSYRLPADGRALTVTEDTELFAAIGHRCDPELHVTNITSDHGTVLGGVWNSTITNATEQSTVTFTLGATDQCIGYYTIDRTGYRVPKNWTVEVYDGTSWTTIQTMTNVSETEFTEANGMFYIDTTVTDVPATQVRFTFTAWQEGDAPIGFNAVKWYGHPEGQFYIPNINFSNNSLMPYIVRRNTANDVTATIISDLQSNIMNLTNSLATLQNRVDELDPEVVTGD